MGAFPKQGLRLGCQAKLPSSRSAPLCELQEVALCVAGAPLSGQWVLRAPTVFCRRQPCAVSAAASRFPWDSHQEHGAQDLFRVGTEGWGGTQVEEASRLRVLEGCRPVGFYTYHHISEEKTGALRLWGSRTNVFPQGAC